MYQRLLMAILFGFLAFGPASAQQSGDLFEPVQAGKPAKSGKRPTNSMRLTGVMISEFSRSALVNGRPVQKGDRVGGVEILAIEQRSIRVRVGADELHVNVGGTFDGDPSKNDAATVYSKPARQSRNQERLTARPFAPLRDSEMARSGTRLEHAVTSGETLSGIALRYSDDGVTMNQMMIALYQSNPQAFSDNINVLHEGAVLRIPGGSELHRQTPAMAAAEVARHTAGWRTANEPPARAADLTPSRQYGPVERGETLCGIALQYLNEGVTMNQMLVAFYQSNPQAFSNNINVLHEGAVLRIPGEFELHRQTPETAAAEVDRQTKAWQKGFEQHAVSTPPRNTIMASADVPIE